MLLKCEIVVANRLSNGLESRQCHATISLGKKKSSFGNDVIYFLVHTSKNKSGTKYLIKENILQLHSRFAEEGKCTIALKDPPHNLIISKAGSSELKKLLHIIKLTYKGQDTSSLIDFSNVLQPKNCDLEKPRTCMKIICKWNYPLTKSFPVTLESLIVNSCMLKKFDMRILRLSNLRVLDLSHNNLVSLCDSLDSLVNLSCIYLGHNNFQDIPLCLLKVETSSRIKLLDLSDNQIKFIPNRLSNLKELVTMKFNRNQLEYLPSSIGHLKNLKFLHLNGNKIKLIPWSFCTLQLNELDLSGNLFHDESHQQLFQRVLDDVPTLYELVARFIINTRVRIPHNHLPRMIQQQLDSAKYCPCGNPCLSHCAPYVKSFDLRGVSHTISYDHLLPGGRMMAKMVGYLCSKKCHNKWLENPNTLFTSRTGKNS